MILIDDGHTELGRALRASMPEGIVVQDGPGQYAVSAYPSVVVDVPAYSEDRQVLGPVGEFVGMERVTVPGHEVVLRLPATWEAVESFVAYAQARAAANPPV